MQWQPHGLLVSITATAADKQQSEYWWDSLSSQEQLSAKTVLFNKFYDIPERISHSKYVRLSVDGKFKRYISLIEDKTLYSGAMAHKALAEFELENLNVKISEIKTVGSNHEKQNGYFACQESVAKHLLAKYEPDHVALFSDSIENKCRTMIK